MLQALCAYAQREELVQDPDFQKRAVDYELALDPDGRFLGLVPLAEGKRRATLEGLPIQPSSRNQPGSTSFLVDNASYVFGTPKDGPDREKKLASAARCSEAFRELVVSAARTVTAVRPLARFVANVDEIARADAALREAEGKTGEKRADKVLVPSVAGRRLHEDPEARAWWKATRQAGSPAGEEAGIGVCLVTGQTGTLAATHPALKGPPFPGTGAKLVSFDKGAFRSHDLSQGANAPVSERAAQLYVAALNHLLERVGDRPHRSAVKLDSETVTICWTRERSNAAELVLSLFDPVSTNADATASLRSVWEGAHHLEHDPTAFYAVTLSVNSARVVVRDWIETTAAQIHANVGQWFSDLQVTEGAARPVPLRALLAALEAVPSAKGDTRGLPPNLATRVFRAAVQGGPLPRSLLLAAVQRLRVPPQERKDNEFVLRARAGLIKAVLLRMAPPLEVTVALDESNHESAYLLGRLFAVLEKLQLLASGRGNDLNATLRDRYYGAASTTPAAVFGRLLALSVHHASKTRDSGLGVVVERAKAAIMDALPAASLPTTLTLEDQGLFAIGYYHQREAFWRKAPKGGAPEEASAANGDAVSDETALSEAQEDRS